MTDVSSFGDVVCYSIPLGHKHSSNRNQAFTVASRCVGWDVDHVDPPLMDWSRFPLEDRDPVNTSFPILIVSNTRDPITPIRSGLKQSRRFLNAGFIEQKSEGHCSFAMVSLCTTRKIQAYFSKGIVPDKPHFDDAQHGTGGSLTGNWTTCEVDQRPWGVPGLHHNKEAEYTPEEVDLLQAAAHLQDTSKFLVPMPHAFERVFAMKESEVEELLAAAISQGMSAM